MTLIFDQIVKVVNVHDDAKLQRFVSYRLNEDKKKQKNTY